MISCFGVIFVIIIDMKPLSIPKSHVIIVVGIPGSGKTTFANNFAGTFKSPIISSDKISGLLKDSEPKTVEKLSDFFFVEMLKTGHTIVIDGNTNKSIDRQKIYKQSKTHGYEPLLVWVQTDLATAKKRYQKSMSKNEYNDAFDKSLKSFTAPNSSENTVVISGKHTYGSQLKTVLKKLAPEQPPQQKASIRPPRQTNSSRTILIR